MAVGVNIVSDFNAKGIQKAIRDFQKLETTGDKTAYALRSLDKGLTNGLKTLGKFGAVAGAVAGIIGKNLIDAASNLEESQSKVNVVFGDSSKAVTDFASTAAKSMGISKQAALEATGTYGNLLQAFGVAQPKAVEMSTTLVQLAGDLASFNNTSVEDAIQALRSGLSGETEPLKRFGVAINDVRLKQEAMNLGLYNGKGNLDINAKTQAAYALILKDTSLAQGDYARTSDGVANTQKTLKAQFDDLKATLGTALIPVYKSLLGVVQNSIMPVMTQFAEVVGEKGIGAGLKFLGGEFLKSLENMGKFGNTIFTLIGLFLTLKVAMVAYTVATSIATVAMTAFGASAAMASAAAAPIALVVSAVVAIGVALVLLYVRFQKFRDVVNYVINSTLQSLELFINFFLMGYNKLIDGLNLVISGMNLFGAGLPKIAQIGEISFGRVGSAAKKANGEIFKTLGAIQAVNNAERKFTSFKVSGSTDPVTPTGGGSGESPIEKAKKALEKYTDAIKGVTQAQRSLRDANKSLNESNKTLLEKTQALAEAQKRFNLITNGYGRDSKQAKDADKERGKAQRGLERANYGLEQAVFAVKDAEKALADLRKDPEATPQAIREAEISLAEAKLSVADATDSQRESTQALTDAQLRLDEAINGAKVGSETFKDAVKELEDAQKAEADASDSVTAALERQTDAVEKLADAEKKRREAGKDVPAAAREAADVAETFKGIIADSGLGSIIPKSAEQIAVEKGLLTPEQGLELERRRGIVPFALGGIVTAPTVGLVGERGAEAIIPLDRLGSMGSNYTINVTAGMGADGKDIGTQIVNALKRYERTNGALPLTVA
jgi:hypothetical protein